MFRAMFTVAATFDADAMMPPRHAMTLLCHAITLLAGFRRRSAAADSPGHGAAAFR